MFVPRVVRVAPGTKPPNAAVIRQKAALQRSGCADAVKSASGDGESAHAIVRDSEEHMHALQQPQHEKNRISVDVDGVEESASNVAADRDDDGCNTLTATAQGHASSTHAVEDEYVKSYAREQRWPLEGEPVCVVCGRYGEYICDVTDCDVCSKECKAMHLLRDKDVRIAAPAGAGLGGDGCSNGSRPGEYTESDSVARLTALQVANIRARLSITVSGAPEVKPILGFSDCSLDATLAANLSNAGFESPTPIQMQVVPVALMGRDLLYMSATGSGKTLAFLLPLIARLAPHAAAQQAHERRTLAVVLAPTRELCLHIEAEAKVLAKGLRNMRTAAVVGGLPIAPQLHRLGQGAQIVVATPGRFIDVLKRCAGTEDDEDGLEDADGAGVVDSRLRKAAACIDLGGVRTVVVDEVDMMLNMGFVNQVRDVIGRLETAAASASYPRKIDAVGRFQRVLFSATVSSAVHDVAAAFLSRDHAFVAAGETRAPPSNIKQVLIWVEEASKKKRLFQLFADSKHYRPPIVVFVSSKAGADFLAAAIAEKCDVATTALHGGLAQTERSRRLALFLSGDCPVLVATGIAGRGLDLGELQTVVNFDMPTNIDEYVHRIGRAGRMGEKGWAVSFVNAGDKYLFGHLIGVVGTSSQIPTQVTNLARTLPAASTAVTPARTSGSAPGGVEATKKRPRDESVFDMVKRLSKKSATE